jgi:hypothetical protein
MADYKEQFELVKEIFDKWSKKLQSMTEGEEKEKFKTEIKNTVDKFYGLIQINNDSILTKNKKIL